MDFEQGQRYDIFLMTGFIFRNVEFLGTQKFEDGTTFVDVVTTLGQVKSFNLKSISGFNETEDI
jgi:hypothetical protein